MKVSKVRLTAADELMIHSLQNDQKYTLCSPGVASCQEQADIMKSGHDSKCLI